MRSLAALAVALVAVLVAAPTAAPRSSAKVERRASLEAAVVKALNQVRTGAGLKPLRMSPSLRSAARGHSQSMLQLGFFSHESFNGTSFSERVKRYYAVNSRAWTVGENLAMFGGITPSAQSIVTAWMASPGHRANLLRAGYRDAGIAIVHHPTAGGVFGGRSTWVVTLDFGRR